MGSQYINGTEKWSTQAQTDSTPEAKGKWQRAPVVYERGLRESVYIVYTGRAVMSHIQLYVCSGLRLFGISCGKWLGLPSQSHPFCAYEL